MSVRIAVVGAGVSALSFASHMLRLSSTCVVTLFEKSPRSVGGRLSTRVGEGGVSFDHGAQYFTARDARFSAQVAQWVDAGIAALWTAPIGVIDVGAAPGVVTVSDSSASLARFVGVPTNNSLPRLWADALAAEHGSRFAVQQNCRVGRVESAAIDAIALHSVEGEALGKFDFVLLSLPPQQSVALLEGSGAAAPPHDEIARVCKDNGMLPCFALMLQLSSTPAAIRHVGGAFVNNSGVLSWWSRSDAKPGRAGDAHALVVHASPQWSAAHCDDDPAQVQSAMQEAFFGALQLSGDRSVSVLHAKLHRWKFAFPASQLSLGFVRASRLLVIGDWLCGSKIEGAYLSGLRAAEELAASCSAPRQHER
jgi:renalase